MAINPDATPYQKMGNLRFTKEESDYYAWLHDDGVCCLTGRTDGINIAHTGGPDEGKGMGRKAYLHTCLPIFWRLHMIEERQREFFWTSAGFPDYLVWAKRLHDHYTTGQPKELVIYAMIARANREYLTGVMTK